MKSHNVEFVNSGSIDFFHDCHTSQIADDSTSSSTKPIFRLTLLKKQMFFVSKYSDNINIQTKQIADGSGDGC